MTRKTGEAVLRGAPVFAPGVLAMSKHLEQGDTVAVSIAREVPGKLYSPTPLCKLMHPFTNMPSCGTANMNGLFTLHCSVVQYEATGCSISVRPDVYRCRQKAGVWVWNDERLRVASRKWPL